jgi:hypothetical protein
MLSFPLQLVEFARTMRWLVLMKITRAIDIFSSEVAESFAEWSGLAAAARKLARHLGIDP